jgi:hypothetical protein
MLILLLNELRLTPKILLTLLDTLFTALSERFHNEYFVHNTLLCLFIFSSKYFGESMLTCEIRSFLIAVD